MLFFAQKTAFKSATIRYMQAIYDIFIGSLLFIYDLLFTLIYRSFRDPAVTIIILSIVINLIVLPLYKKADELQKEEQNKKKSMEATIKRIRAAFKGDERFMMLSAYYKVRGYNPLSFLKESVPLLLQIPFFIAAYQFISSLVLLDGASFGPVSNLIEPDSLLVIGSLSINILPILMTMINLIAGFIYSKGSEPGLKVQIAITALIFLVLLYNSPSGLVLYWTMNNLFSLVKNVVQYCSEKQKKVIKTAVAVIVLVTVEVLSVMFRIETEPAELLVIGSILYIIVTWGQNKISAYISKRFPFLATRSPLSSKAAFLLLILTELCLSLLMGLYIPTTVLSASVTDFINISTGLFSYDLLTYTIAIYIGLFLVWLTVFYFSFNSTGKTVINLSLVTVLVYSLINHFVFTKSFGTLNPDLQFDDELYFSIPSCIINVFAGLIVLTVCVLLLIKRPVVLKYTTIIIAISLLVLSVNNILTINRKMREVPQEVIASLSYEGILHLSRTHENVIVFMLDRAIGQYPPFIFDEKPELLDSFSGFVYYPNTVSFGMCTTIGTPALFGGYEYSPARINLRSTETIEQKHNEALLLMPLLFSQAGFDTTVVDPPYAGYQDIPDLSIYDDYPDINAYILKGKFADQLIDEFNFYDPGIKQQRNFVMYSLYRTAPVVLRSFIYDEGRYIYNNSLTPHYSGALINNYSVLNRLTYLTSVDDYDEGSFLLLQNETTHCPTALIPPDYEIGGTTGIRQAYAVESDYFINREHDGFVMEITQDNQWSHYCINVATYEELAVWLDYLREQRVYDNTRIILVADHGYRLHQFPSLITPGGLDIENLTPLLMVKDFNSNDPFTTDYTFMTNADVPSLAMNGLIDNPVNPFTGNPVTCDDKSDGVYVSSTNSWQLTDNNGYQFTLADDNWWYVRDNIYDMSNWQNVTVDEVSQDASA